MVMGADGPPCWAAQQEAFPGGFSCSLQRLTQAQLLWHFLDLLCFLYSQQSALNMGITMQITVWIKTFAGTAEKEERETGKKILETGQTKDRADKKRNHGGAAKWIQYRRCDKNNQKAQRTAKEKWEILQRIRKKTQPLSQLSRITPTFIFSLRDFISSCWKSPGIFTSMTNCVVWQNSQTVIKNSHWDNNTVCIGLPSPDYQK